MKALLAVLAALGGLLWWRNRQPPPLPLPPDPAEELRAKLAQAREAADDREVFEAGEQPVDEAVTVGDEGVDVRRQDVHERARAAIDELRSE